MRSNVESRRCGCGVILSLRESCKACADKARARLHADGIATMRGQEHCKHPTEHFDLSWDKCGLCGIELRKVRQEIQEKRFEAARYEARTQRLAWYRRMWSADEAAEYKPMPEHIRHELDALRQSGKITTLSTPATLTERQRRMFGDGHAMEPPTAPPGFQLHGLRGARFGAVGSLDEWAAGGLEAWARSQSYEPPPVDRTFQVAYPGTWEDGAPVYTNACGMPSRTPEPPPVGGEVAWDVAKADMQARSEARYRPVTARNSVRFRVHSEQLERTNGDADEGWTADPWAFAHTVRWVRLA